MMEKTVEIQLQELREQIAREIELVDWLDYQIKDDIAEFIRGNG